MKRRVGFGIVVGMLVALVLAAPILIEAQTKKLLTIASGWVVGAYYPIAGGISRIVHTKLQGVRVTVESSGASVANAKLVAAGDADLAILQNDIAFYAWNGQLMFKDQPIRNMVGIFSLHPEPVQILATAASGIKSVKDMKGKRVSIGPLGSGTEVNSIQILEANGLRLEDLGRVERLDAGGAGEQIKDGRIDAAVFTTGIGAAVIVDTLLTGKAALVPVTKAEAEILQKKYPFYVSILVPPGTYRGQDKEVPTVSVKAMMVARSDLPEDLVYSFTKVIFDNLGTLYDAHAAAKALTLQTALEGMPIPLHPGAAKFYKEKGISK